MDPSRSRNDTFTSSSPNPGMALRLVARSTTVVTAVSPASARERLSRRPGQRMTGADHPPPEARAFFARDKAWCCQRAADVGPHCAELVARLLGDRVAERLRAAQGVLALGARYGNARLEAACERALVHGSAHYRTVKTILAAGADAQSGSSPETPAAYGRARFTRSAAELFQAGTTLH